MATQDLSRTTHDARLNYRGVRGQQGRILTDEDLTSVDGFVADEQRADRIGIVGSHGTSNDGFKIGPPEIVAGSVDFRIRAGDYWIGGLRAALDADQTFRLQTDWLQMEDEAAPGAAEVRHDLVVLEVWEQDVSAVEDEALFDPALGGSDTTARRRVMSRVRLLSDMAGRDCAELWQEATDRWAAAGAGTLTVDHELAGDAALTVGFTGVGDSEDLCEPGAAAGYLGAANAAIRVELTDADHFTWGYENGGQLYRAQLGADRTTLTLLTFPKDEVHWPAPGQVVEVMPWGAVLANGEKLAEELEAGHFSRIDDAFDPDFHTFTLVDPTPVGFGTGWTARDDEPELLTTRFGQEPVDDVYVFVRVWDRGGDRASDPRIPIAPQAPLGLTGLAITIDGATRRAGDHWSISARPHSPDEVVPWDLLASKSYMGFHRYVAPLAHLIWEPGQAPQAIDCRARFRPLTRMGDCVTFRVGDGTSSHGDFTVIQDAIDALPPKGGRVLILPGTYEQRFEILGREQVVVDGCGRRTRIVAPDGVDEPVVHIAASVDIELRNLSIKAPDQLAVAVDRDVPGAGGKVSASRRIALHDLLIGHTHLGGVALAAVEGGWVRRCHIICADKVAGAQKDDVHRPSVYLQGFGMEMTDCHLEGQGRRGLAEALGGVQVGGGSFEVDILRNHISGGYGNGVTLGSFNFVPAATVANEAAVIAYYERVFGSIPSYSGVTITDDDCFGLDPNDRPRDPDTGEELVPLSDGSVTRVRIHGNGIRFMGGHGIGVVRFFDLEKDEEMISVDDLSIVRNRIEGVLAGENLPHEPEIAAVAAWAGIALADVSHTIIRENRIVGNGRVHALPTCGIFALFAEDIQIVENQILNNGFRAGESALRGRGWSGGIVIGQVRPAVLAGNPADADAPRRTEGGTSMRVHGNVVVAPRGRALVAVGVGAMQVSDNRLTTQSGGDAGWLVVAAGLRTGRLNLGALLLSIAVVGFLELRRPNQLAGHAILTALGGEVVALANMGFNSELYMQLIGLSDNLLDNAGDAFDYQGDLLAGGDVLLQSNLIRLDGMDDDMSASISAVTAISLDAVTMEGNHVSLDLHFTDFVAIDTFAIGWSLLISGNRFKEPLMNCFLSVVSVGLLNTTSMNLSTHCILAAGPPAGLKAQGNTTLLDVIVGPEFCGRFGKGSDELSKQMMFMIDPNG